MPKISSRWGRVRLLLSSLLLLLALAAAIFIVWATWIPAPMPEALAALQSDATVQVITDQWLVFQPVSQTATSGFIIYPGGRIDPRAYAPAAHAMADAGYLVIIPSMPLNLAVLAPDRADQIIAAYPAIQKWAIGGHSLGGTMAAAYVYQHPGIKILVLWAAYPANNNPLISRTDLLVTSIYGTRDGLATPDKIAASHTLLPPTTTWTPIEGGNHAQFGWYGPQSGDNSATITRAQQQAMVITATLALLAKE
ncbi:MAG: alpha/beta hydrolase [Chloroflexi bacterium]|nr:alpha/beta hydrolase [Chloroflexota bacterium]